MNVGTAAWTYINWSKYSPRRRTLEKLERCAVWGGGGRFPAQHFSQGQQWLRPGGVHYWKEHNAKKNWKKKTNINITEKTWNKKNINLGLQIALPLRYHFAPAGPARAQTAFPKTSRRWLSGNTCYHNVCTAAAMGLVSSVIRVGELDKRRSAGCVSNLGTRPPE